MKLTEEQAAALIKEDLLDINLDMLTSALHDGETDVAMEWLDQINMIWREGNFDNMILYLKGNVTSIDNDPDALIDWMIGIFVERKEM